MNQIFKVAGLTTDILVGVIGVILATAGLYATNSDISAYLVGFLEDLFILLTVVGIFTFMMSIIGCFGVVKQEDEGGRGLLAIYQLGSALFLAAVIATAFQIFSIVHSFEIVSEKVTEESFFNFEKDLSSAFNELYYKATCEAGSYEQFWGIVEDNCPATMTQDTCAMGCSTCTDQCNVFNALTNCPVEGSCTSDADHELQACPYVRCREGMVDFMLRELAPISTLCIFCAAVLALNTLLNLLLLCYNKRDSTEIMLAKTGVISYRRAYMLASQRGSQNR